MRWVKDEEAAAAARLLWCDGSATHLPRFESAPALRAVQSERQLSKPRTRKSPHGRSTARRRDGHRILPRRFPCLLQQRRSQPVPELRPAQRLSLSARHPVPRRGRPPAHLPVNGSVTFSKRRPRGRPFRAGAGPERLLNCWPFAGKSGIRPAERSAGFIRFRRTLVAFSSPV